MTWLNNQIEKNSQKLFIQLGKQQRTYFETAEMVKTYASSFIRGNIQAHDRILIYLPNRIKLVEVTLACFEIGAVAVPISQNLTDMERNSVIKTINPKLIITDWKNRRTFNEMSFPSVCIEELSNSSDKYLVINTQNGGIRYRI